MEKMTTFNVLYIKENNILQLSLYYFGKGRPERTLVKWQDKEGEHKLECICKYGVPGSFDQDVYTACMCIWVKQGMLTDKITLNYSDIARELGLIPRIWNYKIKKSLKRLAQARYELENCFIKAGESKKSSTHFSLFDTASLFDHQKGKSKRYNKTELYFSDAIKKNLEAKYYQCLDMAWYRALPEGLPRRLYEYLDKRRYHNHNGIFTISEVAICRWLPIKDKHATNRRKRLDAVTDPLIKKGYLTSYHFDKKNKLCFFRYAPEGLPKQIEEKTVIIDQAQTKITEPEPAPRAALQKTPPATTTTAPEKYLDCLEWLNTIPYFRQAAKREVATLPMSEVALLYPGIRSEYERLTREEQQPRPAWVYRAFTGSIKASAKATTKTPQAQKINQLEFFEKEPSSGEEIRTLVGLLKLLKITKPTKKLRQIIEDHSREKSYEYAKWSILYANKQVKNEPVYTFSRRYSIYLQKTLRKGYAEEWKEEERNKIEAAKERQAEENWNREEARQREEAQKKVEEEKPAFQTAIANLQDEEKKTLWEKAEEAIPTEQEHGRSLAVKIKYLDRLWAYLADKGEKFSEDVKGDMGLARKMERPE